MGRSIGRTCYHKDGVEVAAEFSGIAQISEPTGKLKLGALISADYLQALYASNPCKQEGFNGDSHQRCG
jgi:hypothetical protein